MLKVGIQSSRGHVDDTTAGGWASNPSSAAGAPAPSPWTTVQPTPSAVGALSPTGYGPPARRLSTSAVALVALVSLIVGAAGAVVLMRVSTGLRDAALGQSTNGSPHAAATHPPSSVTVPSPEPPVEPKEWILAKAGTFKGQGVSFRYPAGWIPLDHAPTHLPDGALQWATAVGGSGSDLVAVGGYDYASGGRPALAGQQAIAAQVVSGMEKHMEAGHTFQDVSGTDVAGLHGFTFAIAGTLNNGSSETEDFTLVLFGAKRYYVIDARMTNFSEGPVVEVLSEVVHTFKAQ